jgi:NAD dependent epimerase/dehydratase family enzyme
MMAAVQRRWGLPAARNILDLGTIFPRAETELILNSRYMVPKRLLASGFRFEFPEFRGAVGDLVGGSGRC